MRRRTLFVSLLTLACQVARAPRLEPSPRSLPLGAGGHLAGTGEEGRAPTAGASVAAAAGIHAGGVAGIPASGGGGAATRTACPNEMALVSRPQGAYCIDRWEASLVRPDGRGGFEAWPSNQPVDGRESEMIATSAPGRKPQGYVNGDQAGRACANANKRLCSIDEWVRACRGPFGTTYPYGEQRQRDTCNDRFGAPTQHPVVRLFEQFAPAGSDRASMWDANWMNDPRLHELPATVEPSGARTGCTNAFGVYDLVGNLHEWVDDPEGTFVGGFFMDTRQNGEGCSYRTSAHSTRYHDYSTGFRCCRDALLE